MPAFAESASDPPLADSYYHLLRHAKNGRQVQVPASECELPMIDVWCLTTGGGTPEERVACTEAITTISASDPPLADKYYPLLRRAKNGCQVQVPASECELLMIDVGCLSTISESVPPLADSYYPLLRRAKNGYQVQVPASECELPMIDVGCLTTGGGTPEEWGSFHVATYLGKKQVILRNDVAWFDEEENNSSLMDQVGVLQLMKGIPNALAVNIGELFQVVKDFHVRLTGISGNRCSYGELTTIRILRAFSKVKTAGCKLLELITKRPTLIVLVSLPKATATNGVVYKVHGVGAFDMNDLKAAGFIVLAGAFFMIILFLLYRFYRFVTLEFALRRRSIPFALYPPKGTSYPTGDVHTVCAVCISEYRTYDRIAVLPACGHIFHRRCLREEVALESPRCPLCRAALA